MSAERLQLLRQSLKAQNLDGFLVPRADAYLGEYVAADSERLFWLTGFSGSAGTAVILPDTAAIITDSRYTIQLEQETDPALYQAVNSADLNLAGWLLREAAENTVIGYDPWLHSFKQIEELKSALSAKNITRQALTPNPVDALWADRPPAPASLVSIFPEEIAGVTNTSKREAAAEILKAEGVCGFVFTLPDSLAWLLNIRGADTEFTPLALSYGVLYADDMRLTWLIKPARVSPAVLAHLGDQVEITAPEEIETVLGQLALRSKTSGKPVGLDYARVPVWFREYLLKAGASVKDVKDPCIDAKAIKTKAEQESIRAVHIKDGAAVTQFLHWFATKSRTREISEIDVAAALESFRAQQSEYKSPSFPTIAGFGPNGAIVHYRAKQESAAMIRPGGILLLDSGAQYLGGTTDITRTIYTGGGPPDPEYRRVYTLVLKGHIVLARARFPEGTTGAQIDALARQPLQDAGLNYGHGTGHGVGCYLSVHEEAASISPREQAPLRAGMLLSNEPGYYKQGAFGVRIENLVLVTDLNEKSEDGKVMLGFETVTLAPFDPALIDAALLTADEIDWVNEYHARVYGALLPFMKDEQKLWLAEETAKLK